MKPLSLFILLCIVLLFELSACQKHHVTPPAPLQDSSTIVGKWALNRDSITNVGDFFFSAGAPVPGTYYGSAEDYFQFNADSSFAGSENGYTGSGKWYALPGSSLYLNVGRPGLYNAKIILHTSKLLTIAGTDTSVNGGVITETVFLKK